MLLHSKQLVIEVFGFCQHRTFITFITRHSTFKLLKNQFRQNPVDMKNNILYLFEKFEFNREKKTY